jgi:hypothetical protein
LGAVENGPVVAAPEYREMLEVEMQPAGRQCGAPGEPGCRFLAVGEAGEWADRALVAPVLRARAGAVRLRPWTGRRAACLKVQRVRLEEAEGARESRCCD